MAERLTPERLAELRRWRQDPDAAHDGDLVEAVDDLLDEIERLRTQLDATGDLVPWPDENGDLWPPAGGYSQEACPS